jgi:hypothetical protein
VHLDGVQVDARAVQVAQQARDGPAGAWHPATHVSLLDLHLALAIGDRGELLCGVGQPDRVGDLQVDQVAGDLGLEVVGGVGGDDPALVDDQDPVGQRVRLVEVVRGQEHRRAAAVPQVADVLPEVRTRLRVEPSGRLVEEDQGRLVDQPHHDV